MNFRGMALISTRSRISLQGFGDHSTPILAATTRWGVDVDFRCRSYLRSFFTIELEGRYSYASMSGSTLEHQTLGNVYGPFIPAYWGAANYSQNTPETLSIRQQLWMVGGSLEIGF